jgi:hypothetical protein
MLSCRSAYNSNGLCSAFVRIIMRPLFLLLFGASLLPAQPIAFGVKGGVPLTDFIDTVSSGSASSAISKTQRYIVGPMFELRLPWGFSIEADALYRQFSYQIVSAAPTTIVSNVSSNDWEFPVLLKYRFAAHGPVRPFAGLGVSFDKLQGLTNAASSTVTGIANGNPPELKNSGTVGAVLEGGLDFHLLFIHIAPEIRYTRWTSQHFNLPNVLSSNQNQAEFLVGLTF